MASLILALQLLCSQNDVIESAFYRSFCVGKNYSVTITKKHLQESPKWEEGADNPPLSARKALKLANEKKGKLIEDTKDWKWQLESVSLTPAGNQKWYWLVDYTAWYQSLGGSSGGQPRLRLVVLMDGTVVEPKEER